MPITARGRSATGDDGMHCNGCTEGSPVTAVEAEVCALNPSASADTVTLARYMGADRKRAASADWMPMPTHRATLSLQHMLKVRLSGGRSDRPLFVRRDPRASPWSARLPTAAVPGSDFDAIAFDGVEEEDDTDSVGIDAALLVADVSSESNGAVYPSPAIACSA